VRPVLTFVFLLPEELLAVVGGVRLLHLCDPVSGHLPSERRREEGGPVLEPSPAVRGKKVKITGSLHVIVRGFVFMLELS